MVGCDALGHEHTKEDMKKQTFFVYNIIEMWFIETFFTTNAQYSDHWQ